MLRVSGIVILSLRMQLDLFLSLQMTALYEMTFRVPKIMSISYLAQLNKTEGHE